MNHLVSDVCSKLKTWILSLVALLLGSCGDRPEPGSRHFGPETIELEKGKNYLFKLSDSEYSILVGEDNFSVMRGDGAGDEYFSPFSVILEGGQLWYEIRYTDGTNVFAVQDFDGDGLGDRRMTFPVIRPQGSAAKLENITHRFELETDPSVRKLSSERNSEQSSAPNPIPRP